MRFGGMREGFFWWGEMLPESKLYYSYCYLDFAFVLKSPSLFPPKNCAPKAAFDSGVAEGAGSESFGQFGVGHCRIKNSVGLHWSAVV